MKTELANYQPNFQAQVSERFIENAHRYLIKSEEPVLLKRFNKKVLAILDYNFDDVKILNKTIAKNGKRYYMLCAVDTNKKVTILSVKNCFRTVVRKFIEFDQKFFTKKMLNGGVKIPE